MKVVRMADADVAEGRIPFSCAEVGEILHEREQGLCIMRRIDFISISHGR